MKIVVIGGTGLIGSKVVARLTEHGHEAVPASPGSASTRSPARGSPRRSTARRSSSTSRTRPTSNTRRRSSSSRRRPTHLLAAEAAAGVGPPRRPLGRRDEGVVGGRRPHEDDRRLLPREARPGGADPASGIPYSIVHATQFFEFIKSIADVATEGDTVRAATGPVPADGGRGRRRGRGPGRGRARRSTASSRSGGRSSSAFDERGAARARGDERPARGRRRPGRDLLRHRGERADACARGRGDGSARSGSTTGSARPQPFRRRPAARQATGRFVPRRVTERDRTSEQREGASTMTTLAGGRARDPEADGHPSRRLPTRSPNASTNRSSARMRPRPRRSSSSTGCGCCPRAGTAGPRCSRRPGMSR